MCVSICVVCVVFIFHLTLNPSLTLCRKVPVFRDEAKKYETLLRRLVGSVCSVCLSFDIKSIPHTLQKGTSVQRRGEEV
jgi:hypothetical protein